MRSLTTIECSAPGAAYTLFETGPHLELHLAGPGTDGYGTGACLCGFDRHARDSDGRSIVGFSVGGGTSGPGVVHHVCAECKRLASRDRISGMNSHLFVPELNDSGVTS